MSAAIDVSMPIIERALCTTPSLFECTLLAIAAVAVVAFVVAAATPRASVASDGDHAQGRSSLTVVALQSDVVTARSEQPATSS